ncbi:MAG: hypothetical protein Kow0031_40590 [Anaerolineae bacterium]
MPHLFYDVKGARDFHQGLLPNSAQVGIHALNPHTLRIQLEQPSPYFLHLLTNFFPLPRHSVEVYGTEWVEAEHIITNGSFRLAGRPAADSLTLERNPTYTGTFSGNLQQIALRFFDDWSERLAMYEADRLDVINLQPCPSEERAAVRQRHAAEFLSVPQLGTRYITFDVSRPPFNDERVRRAFVLATDRKTLVDLAWQGHATPATGGFLPPPMPGHSPEIGLPYQPQILPLGYGRAGLQTKPWVTGYPASPLAIHHFFGKEIVIESHQ